MFDLLFLHGFISSPQSRKIRHLRDLLPTTQIGSYIENYHIIDLYPTKDRFETMTPSFLLDNLVQKLDSIQNQVIIIGSSHGGLLALALANSQPAKLAGLILLAPAIQYFTILTQRHDISFWQDTGYLELHYPRFEGISRLGFNYYEDLKRFQHWRPLSLPQLIIHGKQDELIPVTHSQDYASNQSDCSEYYPAEGIHNLSNVLHQISQIMIAWMEEKLLV